MVEKNYQSKQSVWLIYFKPSTEHWDAVLLIKQNKVESFLAFESHEEYLKGIGHRTAALEDSRLLPVIESKPSWEIISNT
jgi:hypothetical protein